MNCPTCTDERLVMTERSGIEIDYCPRCRGVWLDRGELDKLIERAAPAMAPTSVAPVPVAAQPTAPLPAPAPAPMQQVPDAGYRRKRDDDWDDDDDDDWKRSGKGYKKRSKTKSLLGEIFDF
ncbi:MAG: hypothetical protein RL219_2147 [Actinomycetota bacterium]|jgi:Zn-finger nucleic acid-binding protein